jgi:hypothetical protein
MNIGAPELVIVVLLVGFLFTTVYGAIKAGQNGDAGWLIGIIAAWIIGLGWLVGLIYLVAIAPGRASRPGAQIPQYAATAPAPGWHPDPSGRHEHRYWNGATWTDAVSDQGVTSSEPLQN